MARRGQERFEDATKLRLYGEDHFGSLEERERDSGAGTSGWNGIHPPRTRDSPHRTGGFDSGSQIAGLVGLGQWGVHDPAQGTSFNAIKLRLSGPELTTFKLARKLYPPGGAAPRRAPLKPGNRSCWA